jgi:hypothetical protein
MAWTILNPNAGINITGLTLEAEVNALVDEVVFFDASAGTNRKTTVGNIVPGGSLTTAKYADGSVTLSKLHPEVTRNSIINALIFG